VFFKKNKKGRKSDDVMSFWEHLESLRWHIVRIAIVIIGLSVLGIIFNEFIFDNVILAPKQSDFITNRLLCFLGDKIHIEYFCNQALGMKIINTQMSGQLTISIWVAIIAGLVVAVPYVLWEFWRFIKPALNEKEKKYSKGFVIITSSLFLGGVIFAYFLIVPLTVRFLGSYQVSPGVENYISLDSYISTVTTLSFATGLIFEFPILVFFLTKIGIITPQFLIKQRRYIIVIILVVAAIITPPDVFSQIMVSIPLYGLFEMSIYISRRVYKTRKKKVEGAEIES
jgi:sec-independent protein translocase protein TatC